MFVQPLSGQLHETLVHFVELGGVGQVIAVADAVGCQAEYLQLLVVREGRRARCPFLSRLLRQPAPLADARKHPPEVHVLDGGLLLLLELGLQAAKLCGVWKGISRQLTFTEQAENQQLNVFGVFDSSDLVSEGETPCMGDSRHFFAPLRNATLC